MEWEALSVLSKIVKVPFIEKVTSDQKHEITRVSHGDT